MQIDWLTFTPGPALAGELALLIIGPDLLGLCKGGEAIMALIPEGGIVVRPEFLVE